MQVSSCLLHQQEVVMNRASSHKRALVRGDKLTEPRSEAKRKHLCKKLGHEVNKADRPVVEECGGVSFFRQENN